MARKHKHVPKKPPATPTAAAAEEHRLKDRATEAANYARFGATDTEIADLLGTSPQTLKRHLIHEIQAGRADRRMSLRRKQTEVAMKGDRTMLIWLGKVELGQREFDIPIDPSTLTSDQIARLLDGEDLLAVLANPTQA